MAKVWVSTEVEVDMSNFTDDDIKEEAADRGIIAGGKADDSVTEMFYAFKLGRDDRAMEIAPPHRPRTYRDDFVMDAKDISLLAFPSNPVFYPKDRGMTMHDYFMAHAPAEPQKWFNPVMPPCPMVPSVKMLPSPLRDEVMAADEEGATPAAAAWIAARDGMAELQAEWQKEFRKQLYVQWPAAWADAMLEQRKC